MKRFKFCITAAFAILTSISCTKVIDLNLGDVAGKLVIEGNLTNISGTQIIKLSQNVAFTNTNVYPPVTGASVVVKDSKGNSFNFIEGPPGTYAATPVGGRPGTTYTMTVITNGKTYTASSQMPVFISLDSITSKPNEFNNGSNRREITAHYADRAGIANQYRFVLSVNGAQVKGVFAFNDAFSDGKLINVDLVEGDIDIFPGDVVTVEMQCIDAGIYNYWFTLLQENSPGGGFAPSNPPTNITPAVLGYFSAHTTQSKTIVVK
jgi:hypothetical protein